jgi:hypothetical protein
MICENAQVRPVFCITTLIGLVCHLFHFRVVGMNHNKVNRAVVMFVILFSISLFIIVILGITHPARAQESEYKTVVAEGVAAMMPGKAIDRAHDEALKDAKRNAVMSGVGVLIGSETLVKNYQVVSDKILSQSGGFVKNFLILSEKQDGDLYRMVIQADVASANLKNAIDAVLALKPEKGYPRIMIVGVEKVDGETLTTVSSQTAIEGFLHEKGFDLVDESQVEMIKARDVAMNPDDNQKAAALGKKFGAEIVIVTQGLADYEGVGDVYGAQMHTYRGTLDARMIYTDTADLLGSVSATDKGTAEGKPSAARLAFQKAARKVAPRIMEKILTDWQKQSNKNKMELVISGVSYAQLKQIGETLKNVRGVDGVAAPQFDKGVAVFRIQGTLTAENLADHLTETTGGLSLNVTGISPGRIEAEMRKNQ